MATDNRDDGALEALQSELAFQGDALQALDAAYAEQQQALLTLRRQVELLNARLRELGERLDGGGTGDAPPAEEPVPPHY